SGGLLCNWQLALPAPHGDRAVKALSNKQAKGFKGDEASAYKRGLATGAAPKAPKPSNTAKVSALPAATAAGWLAFLTIETLLRSEASAF
ncbi:MAG: hypothetical protein J0651_04685, partial [Actinobacteria bacterium]|nr:hypothetical protein [Actinomycetota bacterium]